MDFITDTIAIGNSSEAKDRDIIGNFNASLNVAVELNIIPTIDWDEMHYEKVGLWDGINDIEAVVAAVLCLHKLRKDGRKVFIHCHEGRSRAVCIVALYLAWLQPWKSFDEWLLFVGTKRVINPSKGLKKSCKLALEVLNTIKHGHGWNLKLLEKNSEVK